MVTMIIIACAGCGKCVAPWPYWYLTKSVSQDTCGFFVVDVFILTYRSAASYTLIHRTLVHFRRTRATLSMPKYCWNICAHNSCYLRHVLREHLLRRPSQRQPKKNSNRMYLSASYSIDFWIIDRRRARCLFLLFAPHALIICVLRATCMYIVYMTSLRPAGLPTNI